MVKHQKKERILNILGWVFLALGIIAVIWFFGIRDWRYGVWFCNHAMIIVGLSVLKRNRFWLTAMLNIGLIPVSAWLIDFIGKLFFDVHLFGITRYMFEGSPWTHLISLQHLFTVPLMLYALYLLGKPHKNAWIGTSVYGAVLWFISYFFITPDYNINCVYSACPGLPALPNYVMLFPIFAIAGFFLTNLFLVWLFSALAAKRQRPTRQ